MAKRDFNEFASKRKAAPWNYENRVIDFGGSRAWGAAEPRRDRVNANLH
jgi:hypothetical protein